MLNHLGPRLVPEVFPELLRLRGPMQQLEPQSSELDWLRLHQRTDLLAFNRPIAPPKGRHCRQRPIHLHQPGTLKPLTEALQASSSASSSSRSESSGWAQRTTTTSPSSTPVETPCRWRSGKGTAFGRKIGHLRESCRNPNGPVKRKHKLQAFGADGTVYPGPLEDFGPLGFFVEETLELLPEVSGPRMR